MSGHGKRSAWHRPKVEKPERYNDWMDEGACVGEDPDLFFPVRGEGNQHATGAKAICNGWDDGSVSPCPVRETCLEYALVHVEKFGIWGGTSERERRKIRVRRAEEKLRGSQGSRDDVAGGDSAGSRAGVGVDSGAGEAEGVAGRQPRLEAVPDEGLAGPPSFT